MSLCRANSAPAIRSNLSETSCRNPRAQFWGKAVEALGSVYMHRGVHCAAALRQSRSVAARAGATIQALAELGQWRAAAGADRWNGDGLLVQHSICNDHAVGND